MARKTGFPSCERGLQGIALARDELAGGGHEDEGPGADSHGQRPAAVPSAQHGPKDEQVTQAGASHARVEDFVRQRAQPSADDRVLRQAWRSDEPVATLLCQ